MKFKNNLKASRLEQGWTQEFVASTAPVTRTYYNQIEKGNVQPGNKLKLHLCQLFKASHKDLFGY